MKFYHIEMATSKIIKTFIPKIPNLTMLNEDTKTSRICVSTTIEGCLSSVCWGANSLKKLGKYTLFRVYVFETDDYISPKTLVEDYNVLDAYVTNEHWLTKETKPINSFLIILNHYKIEMIDNYSIVTDLNYEIIEEKDTGNKIDFKMFENYTDRSFVSQIHQFIYYGYLDSDERLFYEYNPYSIINGELIIPRKELFYKTGLYNFLNKNLTDVQK